MAIRRSRGSEFGGLPGYWANSREPGFEAREISGSPVPHLERQALTETAGGVDVEIEPGTRVTPVISAARYGTGGRRIA